MDRQQLIEELSVGLEPVQVAKPRRSALLWVLANLAFALVLARFLGPFRSDALSALWQSPQFALEALLGITAVIALAIQAFELSIPSAGPLWRKLLWPMVALAAWVLLYLISLQHPAIAPSMAGKREFCYLQTLIFSLPPMAVGLWWMRRQMPFHGLASGMLLGFAAGAVPALVMQFACMYLPEHFISHHILPGLSIGLVGGALGALLLRK